MSMTNFNSKEYAWVDVQVAIMGKIVGGLRGIAYKVKKQKGALFASGRKARGIQHGKKEVDGTVTLLQSEFIALNAAAKAQGYDDLTDIDIDIIISFAPKSGVVQTDKVVTASFTEGGSDIKEGDLNQEIALPFIACDVEFNVA